MANSKPMPEWILNWLEQLANRDDSHLDDKFGMGFYIPNIHLSKEELQQYRAYKTKEKKRKADK